MTTQEIYDKVKAHLLAQGRKSLIGDSTRDCAYRGKDGLRCAAGCLIADEHYASFMEGLETGATVIRQALIGSGVSVSDIRLVADLQYVHDSTSVEDWPARLGKVAAIYGLTP